MHRRYLCLSIVLLIPLFVGCIETPSSPISKIPTILIDHIEETEETKVFIQGIEDHLFSNITIKINHECITENFTYELHTSTSLQNFVLNVTVWDEQEQYEYIGNITVSEDNDEMILHIVVIDDDPKDESFPHTIIMERKE